MVASTKRDSFLQFTLKERVRKLMDNLMVKLTKKIEQFERVYFHGYDVFR